MIPAFLSNGRYVVVNPFDPGDGGAVPDAGMAVPLEARLSINGAAIVEQSHELVLKGTRPKNAQD